MKEIRKVLKLNKLDFFETHLSLINCIFPKEIRMTPMELRVMAAFMSLEGDVARYRFGPTARNIVRSAVKPDKPLSQAGLSNYVTSLSSKGFLVEANDMTDILPLLTLQGKEQIYMIKLINIE